MPAGCVCLGYNDLAMKDAHWMHGKQLANQKRFTSHRDSQILYRVTCSVRAAFEGFIQTNIRLIKVTQQFHHLTCVCLNKTHQNFIYALYLLLSFTVSHSVLSDNQHSSRHSPVPVESGAVQEPGRLRLPAVSSRGAELSSNRDASLELIPSLSPSLVPHGHTD